MLLEVIMASRPEVRNAARLRVRVCGRDAAGVRFQQDAFTFDVSRRGARLDGAPSLIGPATIIEVKHRGQTARFQVIWVGGYGSSQHTQAGIMCLDPGRCIWGQPLPGRPLLIGSSPS